MRHAIRHCRQCANALALLPRLALRGTCAAVQACRAHAGLNTRCRARARAGLFAKPRVSLSISASAGSSGGGGGGSGGGDPPDACSAKDLEAGLKGGAGGVCNAAAVTRSDTQEEAEAEAAVAKQHEALLEQELRMNERVLKRCAGGCVPSSAAG